MSDEIKIVAVSKDGAPVLVGKHFHELNDCSVLTMTTKEVDSFLKFITNISGSAGIENPVDLYYTEDRIQAVRREPKYKSTSVAICELEESPLLGLIRNRIKGEADPDAFELFLYTMREHYDKDAHNLYNSIRNLTIKKITKVERRKDNQGNFAYAITRGKAEAGEVVDVEPDVIIGFSVPVFSMMPDKIDLKFDVHMSYKDTGDGNVSIGYRLVAPLFEETINDEKRRIISERLAGEPFDVLYGCPKIVQATDDWKYQANGISR